MQVLITGEFSNNFLNGYGEVYYTKEKKILKGYYIRGVLGGVGYEKSSVYIYRGNFIYGDKNGIGTQIWNDMAKYEAKWKDNQFNVSMLRMKK